MFSSLTTYLERIHDDRAVKHDIKGIDFLRKSILSGFGAGYVYHGFTLTLWFNRLPLNLQWIVQLE
jgi:hypothetical protein